MSPFNGFVISENITQTEGGARSVHVPEGDYLSTVTDLKPSAESYDKDPFFVFSIHLDDGPSGGVGKTYPHFGTFSEKGSFSVGMVLKGVGIDPAQLAGKQFPTYAAFVQLAATIKAAVVNKKLTVTLADDAYNGVTRSRAVAMAPASDFVKVESTALSPAVANDELQNLLGASGLSL